MGKAYGLFYSWELLPALTVMGVFLTTVPMGTYAGFKLILGEVPPPKHFRSSIALQSFFTIYLLRSPRKSLPRPSSTSPSCATTTTASRSATTATPRPPPPRPTKPQHCPCLGGGGEVKKTPYLHHHPSTPRPLQMNSHSPRVGSFSARCLSRPSPCHLRGGVSLISSQLIDQSRTRTRTRTREPMVASRTTARGGSYVRAEVGALKEPPQVEEGLWDLVLAGQKSLFARD